LRIRNYSYAGANISSTVYGNFPGYLVLRFDVNCRNYFERRCLYWYNEFSSKLLIKYNLLNLSSPIVTWTNVFLPWTDCDYKYNCRKLIVDKDLVNKGKEYAYRVSAEKFKPVEIFSYLQSHNRRWFIGGKDILAREVLNDADDLFIVAYSIYLDVYQKKYFLGKSLQHNLSLINEKKKIFPDHSFAKSFVYFVLYFYFFVVRFIKYLMQGTERERMLRCIYDLSVHELSDVNAVDCFTRESNDSDVYEVPFKYVENFPSVVDSVVQMPSSDEDVSEGYFHQFIYGGISYTLCDTGVEYILRTMVPKNIQRYS